MRGLWVNKTIIIKNLHIKAIFVNFALETNNNLKHKTMKRLLTSFALCAMALTTLSSCEQISGIFGKEDDSTEYKESKLTPTEHQAKIEQIAIDIVDQFNPKDVEELAYALMTLVEYIPEEYFPEQEGELEEDYYDEYVRSIRNLDLNELINLTSRASEKLIIDINDPEMGFGGFCFEFNENREMIESEIDDLQAIMIKWDDAAITLSWGDSKGEYTFENTAEDILYTVKLPAYIKLAITIGDVEHFSVVVEPNVTDNYTYAPATTIKLIGGYEIYSKMSANNKGISYEASFKKNGKKLVGGAATVAVNNATDPDNWYYEYYDEWNKETVSDVDPAEYIYDNVKNGAAQLDILTLSIIASGDFRKYIDESNKLEYSDEDEGQSYCEKDAELYNKYIDIVAIYNDTKEKIADIEMQAILYEEYDEDWDETWSYYTTVPVLVFPDGSRFALEEFFTSESFSNLFEKLQELAGEDNI